jgi:hypothetical protein
MKPNAKTADILATLAARDSAKTAAAKLNAATSHVEISGNPAAVRLALHIARAAITKATA